MKSLSSLSQTYEPAKREFYCSTDHTYVSATSKHCRRCNRYDIAPHVRSIISVKDVLKNSIIIVNGLITISAKPIISKIHSSLPLVNPHKRAFFVMISSVMVFLTVYLVFAILVTVGYANDHLLTSHNVFLYGTHKGGILAGMIIMWVFMGLSCAFLALDVNLVLFHIFLRYKGLTTFQYITAVEERKEFKKELVTKGAFDFLLFFKRSTQ